MSSSDHGSADSDHFDAELEAHLYSMQDSDDDTSSNELDSDEDGSEVAVPTAEPALGCQHYQRGAKLVAPCCGGVFWCRLCHDAVTDEGEPDPKKQHKINRFAIVECVCGACGLRQEVQQVCSGCGLIMGAYFCKVCKFWENKDRKQFHCNDCGICRVGGRENFRHCARCGGCFPLADNSHQVCIADAMKSTCPVCLEDLAASIIQSQRMACGHMIHSKCLHALLRTTYKCPLCSMSIVDMSAVFSALETEIMMTPMPAEYASTFKHILCNDCHMECSTKFHVLGLKCIHCKSFNTREVAGDSGESSDAASAVKPSGGGSSGPP